MLVCFFVVHVRCFGRRFLLPIRLVRLRRNLGRMWSGVGGGLCVGGDVFVVVVVFVLVVFVAVFVAVFE